MVVENNLRQLVELELSIKIESEVKSIHMLIQWHLQQEACQLQASNFSCRALQMLTQLRMVVSLRPMLQQWLWCNLMESGLVSKAICLVSIVEAIKPTVTELKSYWLDQLSCNRQELVSNTTHKLLLARDSAEILWLKRLKRSLMASSSI